MTVMIVDDSPAFRAVMREMLEPTAESICECSDGDQALETYETNRPDWVLMDLRMKRTDGFRASEEILAKHPHARIIIVSQYKDSALSAKAKRIGTVSFVAKDRLSEIPAIMQN